MVVFSCLILSQIEFMMRSSRMKHFFQGVYFGAETWIAEEKYHNYSGPGAFATAAAQLILCCIFHGVCDSCELDFLWFLQYMHRFDVQCCGSECRS